MSRLKVKSLVLELIHNIEVAEMLAEKRVSGLEDWAWQKQLRFYLNGNGACLVRMVNADFLGRMQAGSYLINTARGGLVDEEALIAALKSGHLTGAGLDCQETEPPEGTSLELVRLENVVAMPHSASKTYAARGAMSVAAAQNVIQALQGKGPDNVVNKEVLEKLNLER